MVCVRENSEGEYAGLGGRIHVGTPHEVAEQTGVFTRHGIERIARYAFEVARKRPRRKLASATKSNALQHSMVLWDEVVGGGRGRIIPAVEYRKYHVDALAARMVTIPQTLDVIVASNLFGDILTDIGSAISGSLGIAPGANINPERAYPSMFEPIHGSAPDIAGKGIANPIGAIWAGALMLDHLGHSEAHDRIVAGDRAGAWRGRSADAGPGREGDDQRGCRRCGGGAVSSGEGLETQLARRLFVGILTALGPHPRGNWLKRRNAPTSAAQQPWSAQSPKRQSLQSGDLRQPPIDDVEPVRAAPPR